MQDWLRDVTSVGGRDRELKSRAVGMVRPSPQPAAVRFDDRAADRQPHAHAVGFGGEEGVEQLIRILCGNAGAAIRHAHEHLLCPVLTGVDHQFARPLRNR